MKLLASGCSLVYGSELSDEVANNRLSDLTYPALLAKHARLEYKCVAYPGNGNDAIARNVIANLDNTVRLVVVNWSYVGRAEFDFRDWGWLNFRSHFGHSEIERRIHKFRRFFLVESTPRYEYYRYLQEIVFLQNYLKIRNIPYIFSTADCRNLDPGTISNLGTEHVNLLNAIDFEPWFNWKSNNTSVGFLHWATHHKFQIGKYGHPLDEAHRQTFELIKHKVKL